jgi:hypothetical protein
VIWLYLVDFSSNFVICCKRLRIYFKKIYPIKQLLNNDFNHLAKATLMIRGWRSPGTLSATK